MITLYRVFRYCILFMIIFSDSAHCVVFIGANQYIHLPVDQGYEDHLW